MLYSHMSMEEVRRGGAAQDEIEIDTKIEGNSGKAAGWIVGKLIKFLCFADSASARRIHPLAFGRRRLT